MKHISLKLVILLIAVLGITVAANATTENQLITKYVG